MTEQELYAKIEAKKEEERLRKKLAAHEAEVLEKRLAREAEAERQREEARTKIAEENALQRKLTEEQDKLADKLAQERALREAELDMAKQLRLENEQHAVSLQTRKYKESVKYDDAIVEKICSRIEDGEMLAEVCRDASMPNRTTVLNWMKDHPEFQKKYDNACASRCDLFEDQLITIADDSRNDYIDKLNAKTGETFRQLDAEAINRAKIRLEMRLRYLKAFRRGRWADNPDADNSLRELAKRGAPQVVFNFVTAAPLEDKSASKVIEHMPGEIIKAA